MRRSIIFLLLVCCWLFGGQIQAFAGISTSSSHSSKQSSVNKSIETSDHFTDFISVEDDDEDLVKKHTAFVKFITAFVHTFSADQSQLTNQFSIDAHFYCTGTPKYISQRVLRI